MSSTQHLVQSLQSSDASVALEALQECLNQVNPPLEVLLTVIPMCTHPNEGLREHSVALCESVEEFSSGTAAALAKLLPNLKDDSAYWCATLLGRMGSDAAIAVPALIDCLQRQNNVAARERAAWALGKIGPDAESAVGALREAAKCSDQRLSRAASDAIDLIN